MLRKLSLTVSVFGIAFLPVSVQPACAAACLRGRTADASGASLSGVAVTLRQLGDRSYSILSGPGGRYEVCGLSAGRYQVSVRKSGYAESSRLENLHSDVEASFTLQPSGKPAEMAAPQSSASQTLQPPADAIGEFHAGSAADANSAALIPDAPSPARNKNLPHGKAYGLLGSTDVTLNDQLPAAQYGASIGGSFGQGRTAYFLSFDQLGLNQPRLLSLFASGKLSPNASPLNSSSLTARLDHQFGQRDTASLRFNRDDLRGYSLKPGENGAAPTLGVNFRLKDQRAEASNTISLSPNTTNETHAQYITTEAQLPAGAAAIGIESSLPTVRRDRVFEAANNIYKQIGTHSLRMGGDFLYNQMNLTFLESSLGRATGGNSYFSQSGRDAGLYVQGEHRLGTKVVATTGIRYDLQSLQGFKRDVNNFSPQLGLAWAASSRTVIRGGVGMYYDQVPLPAIAGAADSSAAANIENSGRFVSRNGRPAYELASFTTMSPTMQSSYAETANFAVDQQLGARSAITAETQYVRGVQLALPVLRSTALCASDSACNSGNSFWGQEIGSGAVSTYTGSTIAFTQQPAHWGNYKVAYTYANAQGMGTQENTSSLEDRMRRLSFTGVLHTSAEQGSNLWQDLTRGFMLTGTSDYLQRSEFRGLSFINLNARLSKVIAWGQHYRLEALAETFNTFQQTNASLLRSEAAMGEDAAGIFATYKQVASLQSPSGSQVGMRLTF